MIDKIKEYIQHEILKDKNNKLRFIQISSAAGKKFSKGRIVELFFKNNEIEPFIICKFSKTTDNNDNIIQEYEATKEMKSKFPKLIPEPIATVKIEDREVFFQEYASGKTISNLIYEEKNSSAYNESTFLSALTIYLDDLEYVLKTMNSINLASNQDELESEINCIKNEFINNFEFNTLEIKCLEASLKQLLSLLKDKPVYRRLVNYDFTPFNILKTDNKLKLIDLEYSKISGILIIEPMRFFYYFYKDLFNLGVYKFTDNLIYSFYLFLSDMENPLVQKFNKILEENYGISNNRVTRKLLCNIMLIIEANTQYKVQSFVSKDFILNWKRYINYFTGAYSQEEVFEYENTLLTELNHFVAIKDIQINQCLEAIEKSYAEIQDKNNELTIKQKQLHEAINTIEEQKRMLQDKQNLIDYHMNEINNIKSTKAWKIIQKVNKIRNKIK